MRMRVCDFQQTTDAQLLQDQSRQLEELIADNQQLKEAQAGLESRLQHYSEQFVDREAVTRLQAKLRDVESRLELEEMTRQRAEVSSQSRVSAQR